MDGFYPFSSPAEGNDNVGVSWVCSRIYFYKNNSYFEIYVYEMREYPSSFFHRYLSLSVLRIAKKRSYMIQDGTSGKREEGGIHISLFCVLKWRVLGSKGKVVMLCNMPHRIWIWLMEGKWTDTPKSEYKVKEVRPLTINRLDVVAPWREHCSEIKWRWDVTQFVWMLS